MIDYWFGAVASYLLFEDSAAADAAVLAAHTAVGEVRSNMLAVLLAISQAPDTVMLFFVAADATKEPVVSERPLPQVAATIRARATQLLSRTTTPSGSLVGLRQELFKKSPDYEKALGGATRPDPSVFKRLDQSAMTRLIKFYS